MKKLKNKDNLLILVMFIGFLLMFTLPFIFGKFDICNKVSIKVEELSYNKSILLSSNESEVIKEERTLLKNGDKIKVTVTVYNPVSNQCDNTPLITADNSKIDLDKLNKGKIKWVAVSRDLLKKGISYGDKVKIISKEDPAINGVYEVHDTMHKRWTNRIDLLSPSTKTVGKWEDVNLEVIVQD